MRGLTRYLFRSVAGTFLFAMAGLSVVVWLTQGLRMLDMVVNRGASLGIFVKITLLLLPHVLVQILPVAFLIATLHALHRSRIDSEMVVMWAAGVSRWTIGKPVLVIAAAVMAAGYVLTLYLGPLGLRTFRDHQIALRDDYARLLLREGEFNTLIPGLTVYVRERRADGAAAGILVHDGRDPSHPITMMAETGRLVAAPYGPAFILEEGNRQDADREKGKVTLLFFDRYEFDLSQFARDREAHWLEPEERYLTELFDPEDSRNSRRYADELRIEGHRRLSEPLYALSFAVIALAAALSGPFDRRGQGFRFVGALLAGLGVRLTGAGLTSLAVGATVLLPLLYLTPILAILGGLYFLYRPARSRMIPVLPRYAASAAGRRETS